MPVRVKTPDYRVKRLSRWTIRASDPRWRFLKATGDRYLRQFGQSVPILGPVPLRRDWSANMHVDFNSETNFTTTFNEDVVTPQNAYGDYRNTSLDGDQKCAAFEGEQLACPGAGSFGKNQDW